MTNLERAIKMVMHILLEKKAKRKLHMFLLITM